MRMVIERTSLVCFGGRRLGEQGFELQNRER